MKNLKYTLLVSMGLMMSLTITVGDTQLGPIKDKICKVVDTPFGKSGAYNGCLPIAGCGSGNCLAGVISSPICKPESGGNCYQVWRWLSVNGEISSCISISSGACVCSDDWAPLQGHIWGIGCG